MALNKPSSNPPPSVAESNTVRRMVSTGDHTPSGSLQRQVAAAPPWAKDEPESPTFNNLSPESTTHVPSIFSERQSVSIERSGGHHRWTLALPRQRPKPTPRRASNSSSESEHEVARDGLPRNARPRWRNTRKRTASYQSNDSPPRPSRKANLHLQLPPSQPNAVFTISHNKTPGWETPWSPRIPEQAYVNESDRAYGQGTGTETVNSRVHTHEATTSSQINEADKPELNIPSRWNKSRSFLLHNNYILLVSRLLNLTFTTITLALAIRIRLIELEHHLRGAVGSSPVLAIIFAPLTLGHVMIAIYLEYFGRPLGLWRTSAKLAHTLSEVLFICAWSAELSLCFDNYFTSPLQCVPHSTVRWYSDLPPVSNPMGDNATGDLAEDARVLCSYQLYLICVVMVALLLYCTNLVISLFRIFEKVKVHQGWGHRR